MPLVLSNRVQETATANTTVSFTLTGAVTGFQTFAAIGDTNTTYYSATDNGGNWEVGLGTYSTTGPTLTRTTVYASSNTGSAVTFSGVVNVFVTYPADRSVNLDASGNASALGTPVSATLTNATGLPVATGISGLGSGVATFLATPSSANLASAVTDETGTGALVFANSPTLVTPALGTPASGVVTNLTGTASININGTVGATTPNTGAFTDLSFSGTGTFSGGTANGVAYLNGSKVLTTGSALTFDGTNFNVVRAAATDQYMSLYADGTGPTLKFFGGAAGKIAGIVADAASASMYFTNDGNKPFVYAINGSEQMRLTSTGLGIGTSSPSQKLDVAGNVQIQSTGTFYLNNSDNTNQYYWQNIGASGANNATLILSRTNVGETLRIDSSGNLGIGTSSPGSKLSIAATTTAANADIELGNSAGVKNYVFTGGSTNATTRWQNNLVLYTGGAQSILFETNATERMRLDSSGNVGIGTATPTAGAGLTIGNDTSGSATVKLSFTTNTTERGFISDNGSIGELRISSGFAGYGGFTTFYTEGSEQMRLTSTGLGIGTSSPAGKLDVRGNSPSAYIVDTTFSAVQAALYLSVPAATTYAGLVADFANDKLYFRHNSATRMTLDASGNLGIGTSSPSGRLTVLRNLTGATDYTTEQVSVFNSASGAAGNQATIGFHLNNANWGPATTYARISAVSENGTTGATALAFGTATDGSLATPAERMRLDSSGNLGLGVTPSAWSSGYRALQIGTHAVLTQGSSDTYLGNNWLNDGANKYLNNGAASTYGQASGAHQWYTAPSGTAGDAISFTQAMTLDASGNLLVGGTSSLGYRSQVFASTNGYTQALVQTSAFNSGNLSGTVYAGFYDGSSITDMASIRGGKENTTSGNFGGMLAFYTRPNGGSDTERARINSSGQFFIGTTTGNAKLLVVGASGNTYLSIDSAGAGENYIAANSATIFQTAGSERARIDASGNFLIGKTSTDFSVDGVRVEPAGTVSIVRSSYNCMDLNRKSDGVIISFNQSGSAVGSISVTTLLTTYNTTSDYRLKTVIGPVANAGQRIDALKPIEYTWNADGSRTRGFLAHQFQEVYASSVSGTKDAVDAEGKPVYQSMQASTSEVIADLVAELQSLRARVAALESI